MATKAVIRRNNNDDLAIDFIPAKEFSETEVDEIISTLASMLVIHWEDQESKKKFHDAELSDMS